MVRSRRTQEFSFFDHHFFFLVPGFWSAHHNYGTRLRSLRNIQTGSFLFFHLPTTHSYPNNFPTITQLRSAYMGIAMMSVMHIYFKFTQPLFIQALMGVKNIYDAKPVAIHILGKPAIGDLKRPFKTASMFGREFFSLPFHIPFSCPNSFLS